MFETTSSLQKTNEMILGKFTKQNLVAQKKSVSFSLIFQSKIVNFSSLFFTKNKTHQIIQKMLNRRFVSLTLGNSISQSFAAVSAAVVMNRQWSGVKSTDPTYEDDRWLEAELANSPEMTAEERYAKQKQAELMRKLLNQARAETKAHVEKQAAVHKEEINSHKEEIAEMKRQMAALQAKINAAQK